VVSPLIFDVFFCTSNILHYKFFPWLDIVEYCFTHCFAFLISIVLTLNWIQVNQSANDFPHLIDFLRWNPILYRQWMYDVWRCPNVNDTAIDDHVGALRPAYCVSLYFNCFFSLHFFFKHSRSLLASYRFEKVPYALLAMSNFLQTAVSNHQFESPLSSKAGWKLILMLNIFLWPKKAVVCDPESKAIFSALFLSRAPFASLIWICEPHQHIMWFFYEPL